MLRERARPSCMDCGSLLQRMIILDCNMSHSLLHHLCLIPHVAHGPQVSSYTHTAMTAVIIPQAPSRSLPLLAPRPSLSSTASGWERLYQSTAAPIATDHHAEQGGVLLLLNQHELASRSCVRLPCPAAGRTAMTQSSGAIHRTSLSTRLHFSAHKVWLLR